MPAAGRHGGESGGAGGEQINGRGQGVRVACGIRRHGRQTDQRDRSDNERRAPSVEASAGQGPAVCAGGPCRETPHVVGLRGPSRRGRGGFASMRGGP